MVKRSSLIIVLLVTALMVGSSNPAFGAASMSFDAGTLAGWDYYDLDGDIAKNNTVDLNDLGIIATQWLAGDCGVANQWCTGADIDGSNGVDLIDYALLANDWTKTGAKNVLLQTIYGTNQDASGTIIYPNSAHALSAGKECLMVFAVTQDTALDKGWFKLTGFKAGYSFRARLYNVTGQDLLITGKLIGKGSLDTWTPLFDQTIPTGTTVPSHTEGTQAITDLLINFGPIEIPAGEYLIAFNNTSGGFTIGSIVRGLGTASEPAKMGTYGLGGPSLPKRATVSVAGSPGNTYFYYLSATTSVNYQGISNLLAFQMTTTIVNHTPIVSAGLGQTIAFPNDTANLDGTVSDDGNPDPPAALTTTWSKFSGPGTVTFGDASAVDTTATFSDFGTYILRLTAYDGELTELDDVQVIYKENSAPVVNAGIDLTVGILDTTNLDATVTDDGLPTPPAVTTTWTQESGPGTVVFGNINAIDTGVTFSATGTYVLRLTADDGEMSSFDEATIVVVAGSLNSAPVVDAGVDKTIMVPQSSVSLNATVTDDGRPIPPGAVTTTWTKQSGSGTVTFGNIHNVDTTAAFSEFGTYVLRLTATDGALQVYDEVTIIYKDYAYEGYDPVPTGGEGYAAVHVTNLNASGPGSFAAAVSGGNRIVVFDVSGSICTPTEIRIGQSNITIDGTTAPGKGITLVSDDAAGCTAALGFKDATNVIVRNIRIRHTLPTLDLTGSSMNSSKCIMIWAGSGIVIDHCSITGAGDSAIACSDGGVDHITISRTLFAGNVESFRSHGSYISAHHNLFTVGNRRIPRIYGAGPYWDLRNNIIDQWSNTGTNVSGSAAVNIVSNYYTHGYLNWGACPDGFFVTDYGGIPNTDLYVNGNYSECGDDIDSHTQLSAPVDEPNITTTDALTAYNSVLSDVGAKPTDAIDQYYITLSGGINPPPTTCGP